MPTDDTTPIHFSDRDIEEIKRMSDLIEKNMTGTFESDGYCTVHNNIEKDDEDDKKKKKPKPCPKCKGRKQLRGKNCYYCFGKGVVNQVDRKRG